MAKTFEVKKPFYKIKSLTSKVCGFPLTLLLENYHRQIFNTCPNSLNLAPNRRFFLKPYKLSKKLSKSLRRQSESSHNSKMKLYSVELS